MKAYKSIAEDKNMKADQSRSKRETRSSIRVDQNVCECVNIGQIKSKCQGTSTQIKMQVDENMKIDEIIKVD